MAIKLENKTNVDAPDSTWPFGKTKDDTGSNDGTPLDHSTLTDYFQFFARMAGEAGITFNGLPDNDVNGWQYYQSLKMVTRPGLAIATVSANALMSTYLTAYTNNYISQVLFNFSGQSGAITFDLSPSANVDDGCYLMLKNNGNYSVTITPDGTDTINGQASAVLLPGAKMELMLNDASGDWVFKYGTDEPVVVGSGGSAPAFGAGWSSSGNLIFKRNSDGLVTIQGIAQKTGNVAGNIFQLPVGFRPSASVYAATYIDNGAADLPALLQVASSGNVNVSLYAAAAGSPNSVYISVHYYTGS
jgi:hypothetical protein